MNIFFKKEKIRHFLEEVWLWSQLIFYVLLIISAIAFVIYELSKPCDDDCMEDAKDAYEDSYRF